MVSRHVTAVLGTGVLAGAIAFSSAAVQRERSGTTTAVKACGGGAVNDKFRPVGVGTYTGNYKGRMEYTMYTVDVGVQH